MYKYNIINQEPKMDELQDLKTLINNDCKIFKGSDFAEELYEVFDELDDALYEISLANQDEIATLKKDIEDLEKIIQVLEGDNL